MPGIYFAGGTVRGTSYIKLQGVGRGKLLGKTVFFSTAPVVITYTRGKVILDSQINHGFAQ